MHMKDDILAMWKSRDTRKTSSLRPHVHLFCRFQELGIYPGENFYSQRACTTQQCTPWPWWRWWHECSVIFSLQTFGPTTRDSLNVRPLPLPSRTIAHQLSYDGSTRAKYNFDPITGWPLKASTPNIFSQSSQPRDVLLPTFISLHVTGLSNLPGLSEEEHPLVVGPPSHSSRVVVGERMPTVTVFSSAAETTLSSSPNTAPRISTSSSNVTGGDVCRVIRQHPTSSPNRALAGIGVGRGSARRPTNKALVGAKGWLACSWIEVQVVLAGDDPSPHHP